MANEQKSQVATETVSSGPEVDRYNGKGLRSPSCADPKAGGQRYVTLYTGQSGPPGPPLRAKYRAPHKR